MINVRFAALLKAISKAPVLTDKASRMAPKTWSLKSEGLISDSKGVVLLGLENIMLVLSIQNLKLVVHDR